MKMLWLNLLCTLLYFRSIFCAAFSSQICVTTTIYCLLGKKSIIRHHRCNKKKFVGIYLNCFSCISKYFFYMLMYLGA